jgi:hypothetical protein
LCPFCNDKKRKSGTNVHGELHTHIHIQPCTCMYVCKHEVALIIMNTDYFEINRLTEDLAKLYSTACATSWFKIAGVKRPSQEEFRHKVVEFMKHFEYTLDSFPQTPAADQFREQARNSLEKEIVKVLAGENKDVEKRYKYYVDYS